MDESLLMAYINNSWQPITTPSSYEPTYTHVENSYRDINGKLHRDIIRKNLAKIECGWNFMDETQLALLQSLYSLTSFKLKFTDKSGKRVVKTMYAGPLSSKTEGINKQTLKLVHNTDITMNFIEV